MSNSDIETILQKLEVYHDKHTDDHEIVMDKIAELQKQSYDIKEQIKPIVEIYTDLNGTKKVMKYLLITASLVVGFILSIKQLK